jgi:membrane-associated protease RseP (regulator of RpoE activity)
LGIPVTILPIFWITLTILGALNLGVSNSAQLLSLALFVLAGFLSILVHEYGHALMIRTFRLPTSITLHGFGGFASYPAGVLNRFRSFLVTVAGPGLQLLLAAGAYALRISGTLPDTPISTFVLFVFWVSLFWALFNCLPIYPLDGGRMLESLLGPRRQKVVFLVGFSTAVLAGIFFATKGTFIMAIFMGMFAWENWNHYKGPRF